ncbi:hypothetical protein P8452_06922 [Trifolium repens]|nr:hypothetical protein P8452_06922 [Trifolium repens]
MSLYIPRKFFRIMQNEDLQNGEIRVPKAFVELHWKNVSNPVVFILPNGATQKIYWVKHNDNIWFQKNWEKFAKFLKFRFNVYFEYIGGSYFKIEICGVNTLEIDYSNIKFIDEDANDEINGVETRKEVEEAVEVSDNSDKSLDEHEIPTQTRRTKNGKRKMNMDSNGNHQNISGNRGHMNKKAKKCSTSKGNINGRGRKRTTNYRSCGENPSFELQLSPFYANGLCLRIPNDFSREYLKGFKGTVKIRFGEDKAMKVKLIIDANGSSIITGGWKPFAEKYNLKFKVDYLCKFEMTQSNPFSFTITINPAITKPNSKGRNVIKHDTFELNVNSTTYPYVSNTFLHRHKECWGKFVKLKVNGKSWSVKVNYYPRGSRLSDGWTKFKEECNLEIGDRCRFKLIDEEKFVFEVSFERKK